MEACSMAARDLGPLVRSTLWFMVVGSGRRLVVCKTKDLSKIMEDPSIRQGCRRKCQKYAPITKLAYSITVLLYYHHVIQILKCVYSLCYSIYSGNLISDNIFAARPLKIIK
jgi:hypothetical protein